MTRYFIGFIAALTALVAPVAASAATVVDGGTSTYFGATHPKQEFSFTDVFQFVLPTASVSGSAITIGLFGTNTLGDIDFTSISLGNAQFTKVMGDSLSNHWTEVWTLSATEFTAGVYDLVIRGQSFGGAAYSGTINVGQAAIPGIPEPASWAMLIGGFAFAGAALRKRQNTSRMAIA